MRDALGWLAAIIVHGLLLLLPVIGFRSIEALRGDAACVAFLLLATLFCGAELAAARRWCQSSPRGGPADSAACRLAQWTSLLVLILFWCALLERCVKSVPANPGEFLPLQSCGGLLMLGGALLRIVAIGSLRRSFRTEIEVVAGQSLVQHGIYRYLRHPSETGLLGITLGACLLLASGTALVMWLVAIVPLVLLRLRLEERQLASAFGGHFQQYAARVPRLLPLIY